LEKTNFTNVVFSGFLQASGAIFNKTIFDGAINNIDKIALKRTIYEDKGLPIE
jgi:hypothetical protein